MKNLILVISLGLSLSACSIKSSVKDLHPKSDRVDNALIVEHEYETDELILDFQGADLPGNSATVIEIKGVATCSGRVQLQEGSFELQNFTPPCDGLNGAYTYSLTTKCQGYDQTLFRCGDTTLIDIILNRQ